MSRLILWDIDGTLVRGARATTRAFLATLAQVYELTEPVATISYGGKTDGQIVRETLALHRMTEPQILERLDAFEAAYLAACHTSMAELRAEIQVLPGVREALSALAPLVTHALLTGNYLPTARLKLEAAGLSDWFAWDCSAFGSDHHVRNELVAVALTRAAASGHSIMPADVVVVGDTPNDIACARAGGVRVVAVATGHVDYATLADHNPDAILHDLRDLEALRAAILAR